MAGRRIRAGVTRLFRLGLRHADDAVVDADDELHAVIEAKVDYLVARGMPPDRARAQAERALGGSLDEVRTLVHRSAQRRDRALGVRERVDEAVTDVRYAIRTLRKSPAFVTAAVVTLALAIGANTAIFSAVSAVILRPLPYTDADRLVTIGEDNTDFHWRGAEAAPANFLDWKAQAAGFSDVAAYQPSPGNTTLTGYGEPRVLRATQASGNLFTLLGVSAAVGRVFSDADTWRRAGGSSALLSYRAWRDVFGANTRVVGQTIQLDGGPVEVVGVLPERFVIPGLDIDVWVPFAWNPADRDKTWFRRAHLVRVLARLAPGATIQSANAALQTVVHRLATQYPETNTHMGASIEPLHDYLVGSSRLPLTVAFGASAALLLIACGNIGNLLLVRSGTRAPEAAVRRALGAGAWRLALQALTESLLVAALGGVAGVAVGWWGTRVLSGLMPPNVLPVRDLTISWSVLGFVFALTAFCGIVVGTGPAFWTARRQPVDALKDEGRPSSGTARARRWAEALLVSQVAVALSLTLAAGLLVRSYTLLLRVHPGFDPDGVLAVTIDLPGIRFDSAGKIPRFYQALLSRARAFPGVESAALASVLPLSGPPWSSEFAVAGRPPMDRGGDVVHRELSPDYQHVMRVPLLRGRLFTEADRDNTRPVVLINDKLARTYFRDQDPIGERVAFDRVPDSSSYWRTIVGVVGDERQTVLSEPPRSEFIVPAAQDARTTMTLVVRTRSNPFAVLPLVRQSVAALDPELAISSARTMADVRAASLARDRFLTVLFLAFAGVGVILGIVGVYGVVTQVARRRTRELGIRMALGAPHWQVQWLVLRRGLGLSALGIVIGVGIALATTGVMRGLLFDVAPADRPTFVIVTVLVLLTAALASWLPAARASRSDAAQVLRVE